MGKKKKKLSKLAQAKLRPGSKHWCKKADKALTAWCRGKPCAVCGTTVNTCGHHLVPKGRSGMLRHTLENILILCNDHHMFGTTIAAHSQNVLSVRRFEDWLAENLPERYAWYKAHEWEKTGKPDHRASCERLTALLEGRNNG